MQKIRDTSDAGTLAVVRRYATGTAPWLAIPLFDQRRGAWIRVVVKRAHLQAAVGAPGLVRASFDADVGGGGALVLNGGRNRWTLRNVISAGHPHANLVAGELEAWARGKRKALARRVAPAASKAERAAQKCDEDVAKLRRKLGHWKMTVSRPHNPIMDKPHTASDGVREMALEWHAQKPLRRIIGQLATRKLKKDEPRTWAEFYAAIETVTGHEVREANQYAKVHARRDGPERDVYLKGMYRYVDGLRRNPLERQGYWTNDATRRAWYLQSRADWVTAMRARRELEAQVTALEVLAASYRAGAEAQGGGDEPN